MTHKIKTFVDIYGIAKNKLAREIIKTTFESGDVVYRVLSTNLYTCILYDMFQEGIRL